MTATAEPAPSLLAGRTELGMINIADTAVTKIAPPPRVR